MIAASSERNPTGQALIQHAAQRVLIRQAQHRRASGDCNFKLTDPASDLLPRDVVDRAQELPCGGQPAAGQGIRVPDKGIFWPTITS